MKEYSNISKTGQKILEILKLLFESDCSQEEINEYLQEKGIVDKKLSKDSITLYINALRNNNIDVARPHKSNEYKYSLKKGPSLIIISSEEIEILSKLKNFYSENSDWKNVLDINNLGQKLCLLLSKESKAEFSAKVINSKPFSFADNHKISELDKYCTNNIPLFIKYKSPNSGFKDFNVAPHDVWLENNKMYLWCSSISDMTVHYLRIDRIVTFNKLEVSVPIDSTLYIPTAKYLISGQDAILFSPTKYDKILLKNNNEIIVETKVINEFWFMQKIMSYGKNCLLLEPETYRQKIKEKLEETLFQYA